MAEVGIFKMVIISALVYGLLVMGEMLGDRYSPLLYKFMKERGLNISA